MKMKVSRLFAVTLLTPKRMVRSSLPYRDRGAEVFPGRAAASPAPRLKMGVREGSGCDWGRG